MFKQHLLAIPPTSGRRRLYGTTRSCATPRAALAELSRASAAAFWAAFLDRTVLRNARRSGGRLDDDVGSFSSVFYARVSALRSLAGLGYLSMASKPASDEENKRL